MNITTHIIEGPLPPQGADVEHTAGHGAVLVFEGVARPSEEGRPIVALDYEAYEPMATRMLERVAREVAERHGLLGFAVEHSRGRVAVGECSLRVRITSRHRAEGLAAMGEFIDRLKKDVPIWKSAVYA